eukprot:343779-Pelagomonas_calceolata.AAC.1
MRGTSRSSEPDRDHSPLTGAAVGPKSFECGFSWHTAPFGEMEALLESSESQLSVCVFGFQMRPQTGLLGTKERGLSV